MDDWVQYLRSNDGKLGDELELSQLQPGDLLRIVTLHSEYLLTIVKGARPLSFARNRAGPAASSRSWAARLDSRRRSSPTISSAAGISS
jgi:hypothetical protein